MSSPERTIESVEASRPPAPVDGRTAFVLSGGGNLGALQVGMLRALLEHDVAPDIVLGCSVGAINGAGFADDPTLEGIGHLERLWKALDGQDLLPSGWLPNAVSLARRGEAIHDHDGLRQMAEDSLRARIFEDLRVPFQCVATDILSVRETWFSSGPIVDAILASSALPAVYPAVEIDGVRYLDGGIVDDVPMSRAVELGATTIYVLQVGGFTRPRPEPRRPLDVAVQAYWIARHHRFKRELQAMPPDIDVHVLPAGETPRMRFNDFTHSATLVSLAHAASCAYLDDRAAGLPIPPFDGGPEDGTTLGHGDVNDDDTEDDVDLLGAIGGDAAHTPGDRPPAAHARTGTRRRRAGTTTRVADKARNARTGGSRAGRAARRKRASTGRRATPGPGSTTSTTGTHRAIAPGEGDAGRAALDPASGRTAAQAIGARVVKRLRGGPADQPATDA